LPDQGAVAGGCRHIDEREWVAVRFRRCNPVEQFAGAHDARHAIGCVREIPLVAGDDVIGLGGLCAILVPTFVEFAARRPPCTRPSRSSSATARLANAHHGARSSRTEVWWGEVGRKPSSQATMRCQSVWS
jgi:hypothetical protein